MNIFMLDKDPVIAAKMHTNKHCVKMITESAQMLSTAHRYLDGSLYIAAGKAGRKIKRFRHPDENLNENLFQACHINHPSNKWIRESSGNYMYLFNLYEALINEYYIRFPTIISHKQITNNKEHGSARLLELLRSPPKNIQDAELEFPKQNLQAMPDKYKNADAILAYRDYYIGEKEISDYYIRVHYPNLINSKPIVKAVYFDPPNFILEFLNPKKKSLSI